MSLLMSFSMLLVTLSTKDRNGFEEWCEALRTLAPILEVLSYCIAGQMEFGSASWR